MMKAWVAWSSGKDSAWALHQVRATGELEVVGLLTTVTSAYQRVSMHGVRVELLEAQAAAVDLPLTQVAIPPGCSNQLYEERMAEALAQARERGVSHVVFGDLFLEDVRRYREAQLARAGLTGVFPLWGRDTGALVHEMLAAGVEAWITCVDPRQLPATFAGRRLDAALLAALPPTVDPCFERGEAHTFCAAGPAFRRRVAVRAGDAVERDGFVFADLHPDPSPVSHEP